MTENSPNQSGDPLDVSIVIPCLNEERNIKDTLDAVTETMAELPFAYEILVVDDGSTDATASIVLQYCETHPRLPVKLHKNPRNRGFARSYVDAAFLTRGKYYRLVCGDNAEPKEALAAIFGNLGKADIVMPYHSQIVGKPPLRRALSRGYTVLVNLFSGYNIAYYNGCAIHLRYNVMRWGPYSFGFGFQAELITRLLDEGASYLQIPVPNVHRQKEKGNSAINIKNFLSVGHTLLEILIRRVRRQVFKERK